MSQHHRQVRPARASRPWQDHPDGFTLIEILVVTVIIGILTAIAVPIFLNERKKAVDASLRADIKGAALAMETYYSTFGSYGPVDANVPASPVGGSSAVPTDPLSLSYFRASPNNAITAYSGDTGTSRPGVAPNTFCILAQNARGSSPLYYDSDKGGLQPAGTGCN